MAIFKEHTAPTWSVAFSPDEKHVAGSADKTVKLWITAAFNKQDK
jgi:WD40 repeat protein